MKEVNKGGSKEKRQSKEGREGWMGYIQLSAKTNVKIPEVQGGVNTPVPHCLIGVVFYAVTLKNVDKKE